MMNVLALLVVILSVNLVIIHSEISDQRLCADPNCKEPISLAKSVLKYMSADANILSFMPNEKVTIYSKSAGSRLDLWGAEIRGKRGYVPVEFVRETKILQSNPNHLVATEIVQDAKKTVKSVATDIDKTEPPKTNNAEQTIKTVPYVGVAADIPSPNKVSQPYEVIHGTTVYYNTDGTETNFDVKVEKDFSNSLTEPPKVLDEETKNVESIKMSSDFSETSSKSSNAVKKTEFSEKLILSENKVDLNKRENAVTEQNLKGKKLTDVIQPLFFDSVNEEKNQIFTEENEDEMSVESEYDDDSLQDQIDNDDGDENSESQEKPTVEKNNTYVNNDEKLPEHFENTYDSKEESLSNAAIEENILTSLNSDSHFKLEDEIPELINSSENTVNATESILIDKTANTIENNKLLESFESEKSENSVNERNIQHSEIEKIKTEQFSDSEKNNINHFADINEEVKPNSKGDSISTTIPLFKQSEIVTTDSINNIITSELPVLTSSPQVPPEESTLENSVTEKSTTKVTLIQNVETTASESSGYIRSLFDSPNIEPEKENIDELQYTEPSKSDRKIELKNWYNIKGSEVQISNSDSKENCEKNTLSELVLQKTTEIDKESHQKSKQIVHQTNLFEDSSAQLEKQAEAILNQNNLHVEDNSVNLQLQEQSQQISYQNKLPEEVSDDGEIKLSETVKEIDVPGFFSGLYYLIFQSFMQSDRESAVESNEQIGHFVESKQEYSISDMKNMDDVNTCQRYDETSSQCFDSSDERIKSNKVQILSMEFGESSGSVLIYLVITSLTLLIFTLGYYYIEKRRRDEFLIAKINELEKALLVSAKECTILQDDVQKYRDKLLLVENTFVGSDSMVLTLKEELDEIKVAKAELEEQNCNLEKELETATDAGLELNRILSDFLSSQSGSDTLVKTVEHLQKQLNSQQQTISEMNTTINSKVNENEILQSEISNAKEKIAMLQMELERVFENIVALEKEKVDNENKLTEQNRKLQLQVTETLQEKVSEITTLQDEFALTQLKLKDLTHLLNIKENELTILQNKIKEMQFNGDKTEISENIIEISHIQAELQQAKSDKEILIEKLQNAEQIRINIENHTKSVNSEIVNLQTKTEEAEREKIEAQTRLEVLSGYFKDKESQLQKELQRLEGLWLQNQGETNCTVERMKSLQEEIKNYKLQSEMLKQEIIDQEVCLKSQISVLEKKAHENWLLARQAERKLEESKQEASQLRNRLTLVEKNLNNSTQHPEELKEQYRVLSPPINTNGDINNSPIHIASMESPASPPLLFSHRGGSPSLPFLGLPPPPPGVPFLPPPPGVPFMPPPPTLFPGDRRPPPLGRMSSPPPPNTFSPSSRNYSPYNRDGSPPPSPPRNPYRSSDSPYRDVDIYRHQSPPLLPYVNRDGSRTNWEDLRQGFKPPHDQRSKQKGSALSSGSEHSSGSVGKINRENQNV